MFPPDPDVKIEERGNAVILTAITKRAQLWCRVQFGRHQQVRWSAGPREWHLAPGSKESLMEHLPPDYVIWQ